MSAEGAVYVEVDGNAVGYGINTLNTSGSDNPGEGGSSDQYWLRWSYNELGEGGFSGYDWYWQEGSNHIDEAWETWRKTGGYADDIYAGEEGFKKYLREVKPPNLNHIFEYFGSKVAFAQFLIGQYGFWPNGGCVELT